MWLNKDESWNFPQDYDPELIKEEKRKELELEIRVQVCLHLPPVEQNQSLQQLHILQFSVDEQSED